MMVKETYTIMGSESQAAQQDTDTISGSIFYGASHNFKDIPRSVLPCVFGEPDSKIKACMGQRKWLRTFQR